MTTMSTNNRDAAEAIVNHLNQEYNNSSIDMTSTIQYAYQRYYIILPNTSMGIVADMQRTIDNFTNNNQ